MFQFVNQTPGVYLYECFNVCFKFIIYLKCFFIFVNLPLRILTAYLVAFSLCFLDLLFQEEPQFLPWSARQTSPPS